MPWTVVVPWYVNGSGLSSVASNTWYVCFCVPIGHT